MAFLAALAEQAATAQEDSSSAKKFVEDAVKFFDYLLVEALSQEGKVGFGVFFKE